MRAEWKSIENHVPPIGQPLMVKIFDHCNQKLKFLYPVYYLERPWERGFGFYYGDFENRLLTEYSEVKAWDFRPDGLEGDFE